MKQVEEPIPFFRCHAKLLAEPSGRSCPFSHALAATQSRFMVMGETFRTSAGFFRGQAAEVTQLDHLPLARAHLLQPVESNVERQEFFGLLQGEAGIIFRSRQIDWTSEPRLSACLRRA